MGFFVDFPCYPLPSPCRYGVTKRRSNDPDARNQANPPTLPYPIRFPLGQIAGHQAHLRLVIRIICKPAFTAILAAIVVMSAPDDKALNDQALIDSDRVLSA
jgi:hypothetical protein